MPHDVSLPKKKKKTKKTDETSKKNVHRYAQVFYIQQNALIMCKYTSKRKKVCVHTFVYAVCLFACMCVYVCICVCAVCTHCYAPKC